MANMLLRWTWESNTLNIRCFTDALIINLHSFSIFYQLLLKQRVKSFLFESGFETSNGPCRGIHPDEDVQLTATGDFEPIGWFGKGEIPFDIWRVRKGCCWDGHPSRLLFLIGLSTLFRMALLLTDLTAYSKATLWLAGRPVGFSGLWNHWGWDAWRWSYLVRTCAVWWCNASWPLFFQRCQMLLQSQPWAIVATMDLNRSLWRNSKEQWIAIFHLRRICQIFLIFFLTMFFCHGISLLKFGLSIRVYQCRGRQGTTLVEHTMEEVSREEGSQIVGCVDGWIMSVQ